MKLTLGIDPDLVAMMQAEITAGERAVSAAILEEATRLETEVEKEGDCIRNLNETIR